MPCYKPIVCGRLANGDVTFKPAATVDSEPFKLKCGSCLGCRLDRARQWAMRCMDEASMHADNSFITLTFDNANLPKNRSLDVSVFQKFMKRLRKEVEPLRLRFFIVANMVLSMVGLITIRLFSATPFRIVSSLNRLSRVSLYIRQLNLSGHGHLDIPLWEMLHLVVRRMWLGITSKKWGVL